MAGRSQHPDAAHQVAFRGLEEQRELPGVLPPLVYCNSKWAHKPHTWYDTTGALQHCPGTAA